MKCRIVDLRCKEVINICDGRRLGFPSDVELNAKTGQLVAIVVQGPPKHWGLFGKCDEHVIPWCDVQRIGDDLVLVDYTKPGQGRRDFKREIKEELVKEILK